MGVAKTPSSSAPAENQEPSLLSQLDWIPIIWLSSSVFLALIGLIYCEYHLKTFLLAFFFYYIGGIGITSGYHRLWSHKSYQAALPAKLVLLFMGTSSFEGSVFSWCLDHRAHHRYTDTDKDPYNVKKGFLWAHIGWVIWKRPETEYQDKGCQEVGLNNLHNVDMSDLLADPILRFQHQYYPYLAVTSGLLLPAYIAGVYWGDFLGGLLIAGFAKSVFLQHATFFINSLAHTWGDSTYTEKHSAKDSYLVSIFTFGEGYHNFHHEFPYDYRNGLEWFHYDPGKWLIRAMSFVGLAWDLKRFKDDLFWKGKIQMRQKEIDKLKVRFDWGKNEEDLPMMTRKQMANSDASLVIVNGIVHDVTDFIEKHPGGKEIMKKYIGLDITSAFNGKVYDHSTAARNWLKTLQIAKLGE